jgi:hypothetical protein
MSGPGICPSSDMFSSIAALARRFGSWAPQGKVKAEKTGDIMLATCVFFETNDSTIDLKFK